MSEAPTIIRNEDGTTQIQWNDDVRAGWYPVTAEVIEQMVRDHDDLAATRSALRQLLDNRDHAMIAGKWYVIVPMELAHADEAAIMLREAERVLVSDVSTRYGLPNRVTDDDGNEWTVEVVDG